jgi:tryptophan 2,3-dioxygenase
MNGSKGSDPAMLKPLTEVDRVRRAAESLGCPIDNSAAGTSPYIAYQSIDVLHALQQPRSAEPAELTFYVMGQVMELLFGLLYAELVRARDFLAADDVRGALWVLRRVVKVQAVLESCWQAVETISATEFTNFRDLLGSASGIQSYMFRQLEFALGNKDRKLAELYQHVPVAHAGVDRALREASIWNAATQLLSRRGYTIDRACLYADPRAESETGPDPTVEQAWLQIFRNPGQDYELFELGEALSAVAHNHHRWRAIHLLVAERILGRKPGTGGTDGVAWLRQAAENRIFPELLTAKTLL